MNKLALAVLLSLTSAFSFAQDEVTAEDTTEAAAEVAAEEESKPFTFIAAFLSDYRFRGISQTQTDPALQFTGIYALPAGFYVSGFAGNVDFGPNSPAVELDLAGGWAGDISENLSTDISLVRYYYPADDIGLSYTELVGKLFYGGFTGVLGYSNDVFNSNETGVYYGVEYAHEIAQDFTLKGTAGYYDLSDAYDKSIVDYSLGVTHTLGDNLSVNLTYVNTNGGLEALYGQTNDAQVVFGFTATF
jgi:uncharacterized protein (TIGR02001 family)